MRLTGTGLFSDNKGQLVLFAARPARQPALDYGRLAAPNCLARTTILRNVCALARSSATTSKALSISVCLSVRLCVSVHWNSWNSSCPVACPSAQTELGARKWLLLVGATFSPAHTWRRFPPFAFNPRAPHKRIRSTLFCSFASRLLNTIRISPRCSPEFRSKPKSLQAELKCGHKQHAKLAGRDANDERDKKRQHSPFLWPLSVSAKQMR